MNESADKMVLNFYFVVGSQPSRSVLMFMKLNNIKYKENVVSLRKGECVLIPYAYTYYSNEK